MRDAALMRRYRGDGEVVVRLRVVLVAVEEGTVPGVGPVFKALDQRHQQLGVLRGVALEHRPLDRQSALIRVVPRRRRRPRLPHPKGGDT